MRLWYGRRPSPPPPADDVFITEDLLRRNLEDVLAVRDRQVRGGIIAFRGALTMEPGRALDLLVDRFRRFGYTPLMRREGDEVTVQAWPLLASPRPSRLGVTLGLFALTCVSTLLAGYSFAGSPTFDAFRNAGTLLQLLAGVPFAATLLAILGVHEFGHYFAARYHRAAVSLPYFIPAPPPLFLFGTLGAIIRLRSQPRNRNVLFDIAAAGPLAGLAVALPAILLGLMWSRMVPAPPGGYVVFGNSLLMELFMWLRFGAMPAGMMVYTHPIADAGWVGLFVTALNLFPVGQLDGGRIVYALFGERHRAVGMAAFGAILLMGAVTWSLNWLVWAALLFFLVGFQHAPPLDDVTPLSSGRRAVGVVCLILLVLLVPPVPLTLG